MWTLFGRSSTLQLPDNLGFAAMLSDTAAIPTVAWVNGAVELIDQTEIPWAERVVRCESVDALIDAIKRLTVRGAPAIGVAGAYGVALAARLHDPTVDRVAFEREVDRIRNARPTAVNLARMTTRVAAVARSAESALAAAHAVRDEEVSASIAMGSNGAELLGPRHRHRPRRSPARHGPRGA